MRKRLATAGQSQVLRFAENLHPDERKRLFGQIEALDLSELNELVESHVKRKGTVQLPGDIHPAPFFPRQPRPDQKQLYLDAERRGQELLQKGMVGAFLVAGGQGTRLGYDGPKGEFPVTPIKNKPLFQVFAEQLLAHGRDAGQAIPWYIMTSDTNDASTRAFFRSHKHFGLQPADIFFFQQGMMPAFCMDGKAASGRAQDHWPSARMATAARSARSQEAARWPT